MVHSQGGRIYDSKTGTTCHQASRLHLLKLHYNAAFVSASDLSSGMTTNLVSTAVPIFFIIHDHDMNGQNEICSLQCRQKTVEVKAKCNTCTLWWCPACLLNRYGEEVAKVCLAFSSTLGNHTADYASTILGLHVRSLLVVLQCPMSKVGGVCLQVNKVAGWSCPRCRDICNCSNCRKVRSASLEACLKIPRMSLIAVC